jgi:membrane associated rhomboid family serine protease
VGVSNRDYMREGSGRWAPWRPHLGLHAIVAANAFLWLCFLLSFQAGGELARFVARELVLDTRAVLAHGKYWQLLTAPWFHAPGRFLDLAVAMLLLLAFGRSVEERLGHARFVLLYLAGALCSMLAVLAWAQATGVPALSMGATGAVYAVLVYAACVEPDRDILLLFALPMRLATAVFVLVVGIEALAILAGNLPPVHAVGHLAGAAGGALFFLAVGRAHLPPRAASAPPVAEPREEPPPPPARPPDVHKRVDRLLAKIHDEGWDALTDEEQSFLREASKRFRT